MKIEKTISECTHCGQQNETLGDIGAAICKKCNKAYRTIEILTFSDLNHKP